MERILEAELQELQDQEVDLYVRMDGNYIIYFSVCFCFITEAILVFSHRFILSSNICITPILRLCCAIHKNE